MAKDHFVPRLIIKRFTDSNEEIVFYSKKNNSVSKPIPYYNQLQVGNFYSKKSLLELKKIFDYISINPLFKDMGESLEKNLDLNVEYPIGVILNRIIEPLIKGDRIHLLPEETAFIKEYIAIQHLRTVRFKEIAKEVHKVGLKLPPNAKELIKNIESSRIINPAELVKEKAPHLNSKARREKVKELKKLLENPNFLNKIRESEKINSVIDDEIKRTEDELEKIRNNPDKHSSEIIDMGLRNSFFKRCEIENKKLSFILNNAPIPFVLSDTGIVIMCWDYGDKQELRIYLPIHPRVLIELSPEVEHIFLADENYVKEFNQISRDDSLLNTYSSSAEALKLLIK